MSETLEQGLRNLITTHVQRAPQEQLLTLVDDLLGTERGLSRIRMPAGEVILPTPVGRFTRLAADGTPMVCSKGEHVAVHDAQTGLIWTAESLGERKWEDAKQLAASCHLMDQTDWRLPTVKELLSLIDYERYDPAVDPEFFRGSFGWHWSSTAAKHPSGYAWYVYLFDGLSYRFNVDFLNLVRAVRAGQ